MINSQLKASHWRSKAKQMLTCTVFLLVSSTSNFQSLQVRKGNQRDISGVGGSQIILVWRWHDSTSREAKTVHWESNEIPRTLAAAGGKRSTHNGIALMYPNWCHGWEWASNIRPIQKHLQKIKHLEKEFNGNNKKKRKREKKKKKMSMFAD